MIAKEAQRHKELKSSEKCDGYSRKVYERLVNGSATEVELSSALLDLSAMLHSHYDVAPVIIIDEYDTPIQQGHSEDYYDKIIRFMRNLFSGGFKDNSHLSFGFLTGILRVAKESIFSGMNNLSINSVLDNKYSAYFGFTADNEIYDRLTSLVNGETFTTFLKVLNTALSFNGDFLCEVALPNREISLVYNKEILQRMENMIPQATAISIQEAAFSGDHKRLKSQAHQLS